MVRSSPGVQVVVLDCRAIDFIHDLLGADRAAIKNIGLVFTVDVPEILDRPSIRVEFRPESTPRDVLRREPGDLHQPRLLQTRHARRSRVIRPDFNIHVHPLLQKLGDGFLPVGHTRRRELRRLEFHVHDAVLDLVARPRPRQILHHAHAQKQRQQVIDGRLGTLGNPGDNDGPHLLVFQAVEHRRQAADGPDGLHVWRELDLFGLLDGIDNILDSRAEKHEPVEGGEEHDGGEAVLVHVVAEVPVPAQVRGREPKLEVLTGGSEEEERLSGSLRRGSFVGDRRGGLGRFFRRGRGIAEGRGGGTGGAGEGDGKTACGRAKRGKESGRARGLDGERGEEGKCEGRHCEGGRGEVRCAGTI
mmetsp:Transcript_13984/g.37380  ORF Transcript_13984/g.37380 Transcript_13984/m.37380 type:complete len:360 (-) Transcript_13984:1-1080(-)